MKFCNVCGSILSLVGDLNSNELSELTRKRKILLSNSTPMKYHCEYCNEFSDEKIDTLILQQSINTKECDIFFKITISPFMILDKTYPFVDNCSNISCPDCKNTSIKYIMYEDHYYILIYICTKCYCTWYLRESLSCQTLQKIDIFT